jgi:hypothetical protein
MSNVGEVGGSRKNPFWITGLLTAVRENTILSMSTKISPRVSVGIMI